MLLRKTVAEAPGTALLLATVVGSGIMGERLAASFPPCPSFRVRVALQIGSRSRSHEC